LAGAESFNESLRLYEAVVERDPLYAPAFNNVVFHYMQIRSMDRAESLVRRVERITGESPNILFARGALSMANGQLATAVEQLRRAYEFNTSASVVQLWYSGALLNLGEFESAADVARSTNKLLPMALAGRYEEGSEHFDSLQGLLYDEGTLSGIGANNMFYWWNEAEYAALTGDVEAILSSLRKSMDTGLYATAGYFSAAFDRYRDDERFIELERDAIRRANAERRKLGMMEI
jgi:hypothetical protein